MKRLALIYLMLAFSVSLLAQQPQGTDTPVVPQKDATEDAGTLSDQVYTEVTIENFENIQYSDKNIDITVTRDQKASVQIRDQFPAPIRNSKKYLGVKVHGRSGDWTTLTPPKELPITDHCQSISIWVYGKNFSGELIMMVRDAEGQVKRLTFGKLNFLGWRKLTVLIPKDFPQEDKYLAQPRNIYIVKFQYNPGRTDRLKETDWDYFYMDDISAKVRKKYVDKQSDSW